MLRVDPSPTTDRLAQVEAAMLAAALADLDDADLAAAARQHLAGGSRHRARLVLELAAALGAPERSTLAVATCVELLHAASLVHDDLQDGARTRRGAPSVAAAYGDDTALLLGDVLIAAAFEAVAALPHADGAGTPVRRVRRAVAATASGQHRERAHAHQGDLEHYTAIAAAKSAPLFALPFELALDEAGFGAAIPQARRAAFDFAVGYQLRDDLDDLADDAARGEANGVLVLEDQGYARPAAVAAIADLARAHLADAVAAGARLPRDVGAPLVRLATALRDEVVTTWT